MVGPVLNVLRGHEVGGEMRWLKESDLLIPLPQFTPERIMGVPCKLCFSHLGSKLRHQRYQGPNWPAHPAFGSPLELLPRGSTTHKPHRRSAHTQSLLSFSRTLLSLFILMILSTKM